MSTSGRRDAAQALVVLRRRVDQHFDAAVARDPTEFACKARCSDCCQAGLSIFAVEADRIRTALAQLPASTRAQVRGQAKQASPTHCPLLIDQLCVVYDERPMLCRSHGLAVRPSALQNPDTPQAEHCPLNYTGRAPSPKSVLDLDAVNRPLAVMAQMWGGGRIALNDLAQGTDE